MQSSSTDDDIDYNDTINPWQQRLLHHRQTQQEDHMPEIFVGFPSPATAVDSTSSPASSVDSTSSPASSVDSTSSPALSVDSTSSPATAVDSTILPASSIVQQRNKRVRRTKKEIQDNISLEEAKRMRNL